MTKELKDLGVTNDTDIESNNNEIVTSDFSTLFSSFIDIIRDYFSILSSEQ